MAPSASVWWKPESLQWRYYFCHETSFSIEEQYAQFYFCSSSASKSHSTRNCQKLHFDWVEPRLYKEVKQLKLSTTNGFHKKYIFLGYEWVWLDFALDFLCSLKDLLCQSKSHGIAPQPTMAMYAYATRVTSNLPDQHKNKCLSVDECFFLCIKNS